MTADEVFTTGTMGELSHVMRIDGRAVGTGEGPGPVTRRLQALFAELVRREGDAIDG
jgi:branched-subunit amino acid aminotransferase/4-amino-4-deoxychorismate lyase